MGFTAVQRQIEQNYHMNMYTIGIGLVVSAHTLRIRVPMLVLLLVHP